MRYIILGLLKIVLAGPAPDDDGFSLPAFVSVWEVHGNLAGVLAVDHARCVSGPSCIALIDPSYVLDLNPGYQERGRRRRRGLGRECISGVRAL